MNPPLKRILAAVAITAAAAAVPASAAALTRPSTSGQDRAIRPCTTSGLDAWLNTQGQGATQSIVYGLMLTNLSGHKCVLRGIPNVTAIDLNGRRIGRPALRIYQGQQGRVTVRNGHSALVPLQVFEARLLYPRPRCRPVTAAGLRVYPPGQNRSRVVPFPLVVCSSRRIVSMNVSPVMPGR